jgi:hypothetical protein
MSLTIGTQSFSENSFTDNTSPIVTVSPVRFTRSCFMSSTTFSTFSFFFIFVERENEVSSSSKKFLEYLEFLSFLKNFALFSDSSSAFVFFFPGFATN